MTGLLLSMAREEFGLLKTFSFTSFAPFALGILRIFLAETRETQSFSEIPSTIVRTRNRALAFREVF